MREYKVLNPVRVLLTTVALMICMCIPAFAYTSVSGVKQTAATANSITVAWTASDATSFDVEIQDLSVDNSKRTWVKKATGVKTTSYTITGLTSGNKYEVKVTGYKGSDSDYATLYDGKTLIDKMRKVWEDQYYHFAQIADIDWEKLPAADGYEYKFSNYKGKVIESKKVSGYSTSVSFYKLQTSTIYTFSIRAYQTFNGQTTYTPWESINVFEQAWVKSVKKSGNKLTIKFDPVKGATGYEIYVSSNPKKGYKKVKTLKKNKRSVTIKKVGKTKISKKKKWYVYVITKKKNDRSGKVYYWKSQDRGRSYNYL
ncbi:MAG: fibronectin type III domain-containing protein [Lachnospiraceae bacterium]|nr:fibronectin type III domain-containing protein [Lachnospiraceae bacterium]